MAIFVIEKNRRHLSRGMELTIALAALGGSLILNYWAANLAEMAGDLTHPSPDLLLNILPTVDMTFFFTWGFGTWFIWVIAATVWKERRRAAYIIWLYAILTAVRSLFIILTPMRIPEGALSMHNHVLYEYVGQYLTLQNDLFFSSHTAYPFLAYLIFRDRWVRYTFLGLSLLLAMTVLLSKLHYSIDVFAAYFITHSIYEAELRWFHIPYTKWRKRWVDKGQIL
ncbi:MAG: hypothetical protein HY747_07010 [Elusimicrobia bacterium]|nr:hypothetical protein [Elusimicrobiota bacterium]